MRAAAFGELSELGAFGKHIALDAYLLLLRNQERDGLLQDLLVDENIRLRLLK